MTVIETIAAWCARRREFSPAAQQAARDAIVDTLACLYAGRHDFSSRSVLRAFSHYQPMPAAIVALTNATAAHAIDYDDNFGPGMSHASAVLVPALLAVALEEGCHGQQLINAYLVGLQAQAFVGEAMSHAHYTAGWHGTSTIGAIGTAAGVAWLKGLDETGIARALTVAVSLACGVKGQFGTAVKPLHAGIAARNAVDAAQLAACGMAGRLDIIERDQGFYQLFAGAGFDPARVERWLTPQRHVIETVGVLPKRHPCCGSTHRVLDAIADLQSQHRFHHDEVASVAARVGIANRRNLAYDRPTDEMQARFSMPYCVNRLLEKGSLSVGDFTPSQVQAHSDAARLARITMTSWSERDEQTHGNPPHQVTVTLRDGRVLHAERRCAKGALDDPFSPHDKQRKFADCCFDLPEQAALYPRLQRLEQETQLDFLRVLMMPLP